jgi:hypothetical protein
MSERARELMEDRAFNQIAWNNATPEGREDLLRDFFAEVNEILGHMPRQDLTFFELAPWFAGSYSIDTGQIIINTVFLQDSDSERDMRERREQAMLTVIHEARHEFQHNTVRHPNHFVISLETRNHWQDNFNNYIEFIEGVGYYTQPIEWDAWNFEGPSGARRVRELVGNRNLVEYEGSWPW